MRSIFEISTIKSKDTKVQAFYKKAMDELIRFYQLNWVDNTPIIYLVDSRKIFNLIGREETQNWVVGKALDYNKLLLISPNKYEKESCHKYSDELYYILMKHELSHLFYNILSQNKGPVWLDEGLAIYTSGELKTKNKPPQLRNFLKYYDYEDALIYKEAGYVIEALIKKFGNKKLLAFLRLLPKVESKQDFKRTFENFFGITMTYKDINKLF